MSTRAKESNLWAWLKQAEQQVEPGQLCWERIENSIARGTPDVHGVYRCVAFVTELKAVPRPVRGPVDTELRVEQALKLRAWWRAGGLSWVCIQVGVGRQAKRYLIEGKHADVLCSPVQEAVIATMSIVPDCQEQTPLRILKCMIGK